MSDPYGSGAGMREAILRGRQLRLREVADSTVGNLQVDPYSGAIRAEKNLRALPREEFQVFELPFGCNIDVYANVRPQPGVEPIPGTGSIVRIYAKNDQQLSVAGWGRIRFDPARVSQWARSARCAMAHSQGAQSWVVTCELSSEGIDLIPDEPVLSIAATVYNEANRSSGKYLQTVFGPGPVAVDVFGVVERVVAFGIGGTVQLEEDQPPFTLLDAQQVFSPRYGSLVNPRITFGAGITGGFIEATT